MVESGDQNGHGLDMVHADIKLVLQHSSSFIAHATEGLSPLLCGLRAQVPEDPERKDDPNDDPYEQNLPPPSLPESLRPSLLVVRAVVDLVSIPQYLLQPIQ